MYGAGYLGVLDQAACSRLLNRVIQLEHESSWKMIDVAQVLFGIHAAGYKKLPQQATQLLDFLMYRIDEADAACCYVGIRALV